MELTDGTLHVTQFFTVTLGIIVLFVGKRINDLVPLLREYSIPEPVTGGLLFSVMFTVVHATTGVGVEFDLTARDALLVYFFTTIGINASFKDLLAGGKPLVILLVVTIAYMFLQNLTGISMAKLLGQPSAVGLLGGTVSLIGGYGTAIAWAPKIAADYGVPNAMEIGTACATFGLILASLMGGPIAKFLIKRHKITPNPVEAPDVASTAAEQTESITYQGVLDALLALHVCIFFGMILNEGLNRLGLQLPLFVTCLFAGILITNLMPRQLPRLSGFPWPSRTLAISMIADISLGTFLAMSLMSLQLWALAGVAGPIFAILGMQFIVAVLVNIIVVFRVMGRNYDAAVVCSGFGGISLGSTPTAMANMSAVAQRYGPSHLAFIIVPLVCAFFVDLVNAVLIPFFLNNF